MCSVDQCSCLSAFFNAIEKDSRIAPVHISVYAALLHRWTIQQYQNPVSVYSHEIMRWAKILTRYTYLKVIADLSHYGYLRYEPSLNRKKASKIYLQHSFLIKK